MINKHNLPLVIGIAIPLLMIIFVAVSIYVPSSFAKPKYNFLYSTGGQNYNPQYYVKDSRLVMNQNSSNVSASPGTRPTKLFLHDIGANKSQAISFNEAQKLTINDNFKSPDGFEAVRGGYGGDLFGLFFSGSSDYNSWYIKGKNVSRKLDLQISDQYYDFAFLGWVNQ